MALTTPTAINPTATKLTATKESHRAVNDAAAPNNVIKK